MAVCQLFVMGCTSETTNTPSVAASPSATAASASPTASACPAKGSPSSTNEYPTPEAAGIAGIEGQPSLRYCPGGCAAGGPCATRIQVFGVTTSGTNSGAAYVQATIVGAPDFQSCYVYMYYDSNSWHDTTPVVCPRQAGTYPVLGGQDNVNVSGGCANMRSGPGLAYPVVSCLKNGTSVLISVDFPQYKSGHIWWHLSQPTDAWMAHEFLIAA